MNKYFDQNTFEYLLSLFLDGGFLFVLAIIVFFVFILFCNPFEEEETKYAQPEKPDKFSKKLFRLLILMAIGYSVIFGSTAIFVNLTASPSQMSDMLTALSKANNLTNKAHKELASKTYNQYVNSNRVKSWQADSFVSGVNKMLYEDYPNKLK